MSKITFYVGMNIQDLKFNCGGTAGLSDGVIRYGYGATHRELIESRLHPQKIAEKVLYEIQYCAGNWDMHISTHSDVPINLVGYLIGKGTLRAEDVRVMLMSDDNLTVMQESTFNPEGFLENWPYGFLDYDIAAAKRNVKFDLPALEVKIEQ